MERIRDSRRTSSPAFPPPRRPRLTGPKDASDDDERTDDASESRPWERPKKERISSFHVSVSTNPRKKRRRQGLQEAQAHVRSSACEDADESTEETEIAASEDDDEPPPPPILRRLAKSRGNGKEDEIVMDIPTVPRKARSAMSSSSRFSSISRRPQDSLPPADGSRQVSPPVPQTSLNGISSPTPLGKHGRRLKSTGTKIRAIKTPKVPEPTSISDQEVEVAEALFVLARSTPSHAKVSESKFEQKIEAKHETEVSRAVSPPRISVPSAPPVVISSSSGPGTSCSTANEHHASLPAAEAPKRKRPRIVPRQEEGRASAPIRMVSPAREAEQATSSEKGRLVFDENPSVQPEPWKGKSAMDPPNTVPQLHSVEVPKMSSVDAKDPEEEAQNSVDIAERKSGGSDPMDSSPANVKVEASVDIPVKDDNITQLEFLTRPGELLHVNDRGTSKLNIDLMAPPLKASLKEEDVHDMQDDKHTLLEDIAIKSTKYPAEAPRGNLDEAHNEMKDANVGLKKEEAEEKRIAKDEADSASQEQKQENEEQMCHQQQKEQIPCQIQREESKELESESDRECARGSGLELTKKADTGTSLASSFLPSALSTAASTNVPVALAGWMGGLPPLGYYGSGAPPWPVSPSLPGSNIDGKSAHLAVQVPHATVLPPVPRMKRCATHVYIARHIYREQQCSRHTLWSTAYCRGAPYNLNIPPVNLHDKEKINAAYVDLAQKVPTQQSGPAYGYTVSQSNGSGMACNSGTLGSSTSGNTMSSPIQSTIVDAGAGTGSGTLMNMAAHAPYIQAMNMAAHASFSFPFNGTPGQATQFFNGPFYPAHLMPPLPHLQALAQQAANLHPPQNQQQGLCTLPHSSASQLLTPPPQQQQQQLQLQLTPQSPSSLQQQHHLGTSTQHFVASSEKHSAASGESHSTAESRLSAMRRSMCGQGHSNLPNLNISPSSLMPPSIPALSSHHQDVSLMVTLGGKQTSKSQQQSYFHGQQSAPLSPPIQQQQQLVPQNSGGGSGLQIKGLDSSLPQGCPPIAMSSIIRGSVGPGSLGPVSVASAMASQGSALLSASENARLHIQQQQGFAGNSQQYHQMALPRASPSVSEETYLPNTSKGREFVDDRKLSAKQGGGPLNLTKIDMEASSGFVQGSPTSGGVPTARMTNNAGRTFNLTTSTGARNSRPAVSMGIGQVPQLQNQVSKQSMARTKAVSTTNVSPATTTSMLPAYMERVPLPGNVRASGTALPCPGQLAPCSQGSKQSQVGMAKVGQRTSQAMGMPTASGVSPQVMLTSAMAKSQGQQHRTNQQGSSTGTPPRMPSSVPMPVLSSGTLSLSSSHSQSPSKAAGSPVSKSPSNGKGTVPITKSAAVPVKRSPVSSPAMSSVMSPGQNVPAKAPLQQKSQSQSTLPQFSQQQSTIPVQQQQLGTKHQVYHQQQPQQGSQYKQAFQAPTQFRPQFVLQQSHQQFLQHSSLQQQALAQQPQPPQYLQQSAHSSPIQNAHTNPHSRHDQHHPHVQQLQSVSSSLSTATINGLSLSPPNLTLGTGIPGNKNNNTNLDGAEQFQGSVLKGNIPKAVSNSGNHFQSGGISESNMMLRPSSAAMPGHQVNSPHSGSSYYLQLAPVLGVKPIEQKASPDGVNREEMSNIRHLPSSSPSHPTLITNPTSS